MREELGEENQEGSWWGWGGQDNAQEWMERVGKLPKRGSEKKGDFVKMRKELQRYLDKLLDAFFSDERNVCFFLLIVIIVFVMTLVLFFIVVTIPTIPPSIVVVDNHHHTTTIVIQRRLPSQR